MFCKKLHTSTRTLDKFSNSISSKTKHFTRKFYLLSRIEQSSVNYYKSFSVKSRINHIQEYSINFQFSNFFKNLHEKTLIFLFDLFFVSSSVVSGRYTNIYLTNIKLFFLRTLNQQQLIFVTLSKSSSSSVFWLQIFNWKSSGSIKRIPCRVAHTI